MMRRKVNAFSLLEVGLALLIIGIMGSQLIPMIKQTLALKKQELTKRNQEIILQSVASYTKLRQHLPFASTPIAKGTQQIGLSIGIPPYQTLGLDERIAKDGFGHYITYAINTTLGNTVSITEENNGNKSFCSVSNQALSPLVVSEQAIPLPDYIAIILIAHDKGEGAYTHNGNRSPFKNMQTEISRCRGQNITDSGTFCTKSSGDIISWVTRSNFLSSYMQTLCPRTSTRSTVENTLNLQLDFPETDPQFDSTEAE